MNARSLLPPLTCLAMMTAAACGRSTDCADCDTLRIAATGEPATLVPPLVEETVGRDVSDQIFERLAVLGPGRSPGDPTSYRPGLATRWEAVDSTGWLFTLRSGARWHDGAPVTARDVVFSFAAYVDTALGTPAPALAGRAVARAIGDTAVLIRFDHPAPELLYDATSFVRIIPEHIWGPIPRADWSADTAPGRIVGSGPFRLAQWRRAEALILERADSSAGDIRRLVWLFAADQDGAANLLLAGQADLVETLASPNALALVERDTTLARIRYPSAVYGFVGFRHRTASGAPDPVLGERAVRRALTAAIDRPSLVRAVIGPDAAVPAGPVSRASWLWDPSVRAIPFDTAEATRLLDSAGYRRGADGVRTRGGRRLAVDILVPGTSRVRRDLAQGIEAMWRAVGVAATITAVDFPVFQQRLGRGEFQTMVAAWLDDPSPRGLADQWTRHGWGDLNYGRYANPVFDSLFAVALGTAETGRAKERWRQAFDSLNADAAAVFLYNPTNTAVTSRRRVRPFDIDPFSWLSGAIRR